MAYIAIKVSPNDEVKRLHYVVDFSKPIHLDTQI